MRIGHLAWENKLSRSKIAHVLVLRGDAQETAAQALVTGIAEKTLWRLDEPLAKAFTPKLLKNDAAKSIRRGALPDSDAADGSGILAARVRLHPRSKQEPITNFGGDVLNPVVVDAAWY